MAFSLAVYRLADRDFTRNPPATDSPDFDQWYAECDQRLLFEAPVGSDWHVAQFWSTPAAELGLHLLQGLYDNGLEVAGEALTTLRTEVETLERHWIESVEDDAPITYVIAGREFAVPLLFDLIGRAEQVLAGVRLAQRITGVLMIS